MEIKLCTCCHRTLPIVEFGRNIKTKDGLAYYCKSCMRKKRQKSVDKWIEIIGIENYKKRRHEYYLQNRAE